MILLVPRRALTGSDVNFTHKDVTFGKRAGITEIGVSTFAECLRKKGELTRTSVELLVRMLIVILRRPLLAHDASKQGGHRLLPNACWKQDEEIDCRHQVR
jgi:hypothetical protein